MKYRSVLSSLKVLVVAALVTAATLTSPQGVLAATEQFAGTIRGTLPSPANSDYVIALQNDGKCYAALDSGPFGDVVIVGTINHQTGAFTASGQHGDDSLTINGTATIDPANTARIKATGTFQAQVSGFPFSGSFSGSGVREVEGAHTISGMVFRHETTVASPAGPASKVPYVGWFVRLFRNGKLVSITASAADGTYAFTGRTDGPYVVRVRPPSQFVNPVREVTVAGADVPDINFRSTAVYVYVFDENGDGLGSIPVQVKGNTTKGFVYNQTASTDDTTKRIGFFIGNGTFLVKPLPQEGFVFDPPSRTVTLPGTGTAAPTIRARFTRKVAPTVKTGSSAEGF